MNDSNLFETLNRLYGKMPSASQMDAIKRAIELDTKEDHAFCRDHVKIKMKQRALSGGIMPEGSNFVND